MGCCIVCVWCCCYDLCGCVYGVSLVRFVLSLFYLCAIQCVLSVWLHLIEGCCFFICLRQRSQIYMTGACLFVCVVGPGFDSTYPTFVRSRASHAAGSDGWLAPKKRNRATIFWGQVCVDTICTDVCSTPTSCRLCLFGTPFYL